MFAMDDTCLNNCRAVLEFATFICKIHCRITLASWFSLCFGSGQAAILKLTHTRDLAARIQGLAAGRLRGIT